MSGEEMSGDYGQFVKITPPKHDKQLPPTQKQITQEGEFGPGRKLIFKGMTGQPKETTEQSKERDVEDLIKLLFKHRKHPSISNSTYAKYKKEYITIFKEAYYKDIITEPEMNTLITSLDSCCQKITKKCNCFSAKKKKEGGRRKSKRRTKKTKRRTKKTKRRRKKTKRRRKKRKKQTKRKKTKRKRN